MRKLTAALIIAIASGMVHNVMAAGCEIGAPKTQRVTLPDLVIDPNLPPGSVIGIKTVSVAGWIAQSCNGSINWRSVMTGNWSSVSDALPGVYNTGIPGVGVKVTDYLLSDRFVPLATSLTPEPNTPLLGTDILLMFYRTGDITPGSFPGGEVVRFTLPDSDGNPANVLSLQVVSGSVRIKSCYAKSPNLIVQLGRVNRSAFTGPGSIVTPTVFKIELLCQGDSPVNVSFSSASSAPSTEPGRVPIDNMPGAASGVAIKVMQRDGSPLRFDTPQSYHNAGEREIAIPLLATYTAVSNTITPGVARGAITFTITQN